MKSSVENRRYPLIIIRSLCVLSLNMRKTMKYMFILYEKSNVKKRRYSLIIVRSLCSIVQQEEGNEENDPYINSNVGKKRYPLLNIR